MIVTALPLDWPVLDWVPAERDNFELLRDRSDESEVLAAAVCDRLAGWVPHPLSQVRLLDYGAEPASRLAALLQARVGSYTPVRLGGEADAEQYLADLASAGHRPAIHAVLLCHVLPYVHRPDRLFTVLARYAEPQAVTIAVLLAPHGDQYELTLRAQNHDPAYRRCNDHADRLQRWLAVHAIPSTAALVWSHARAEDEATLRRLVEFMLGSADARLVDAVAAGVPRGDGAGAVIRTAHTVLAWPLRHHLPGQLTAAEPLTPPAPRPAQP
jgi:hypothetical protein